MESEDEKMKRISKALVAGLFGGLSAVAGTLTFTGAPTQDEISKAIGVFVVSAVVAAWAVYKTPTTVRIP